MFRKKSDDDKDAKAGDGNAMSAPPLKPFSNTGARSPGMGPAKPAAFRPEPTRRIVDIPGASRPQKRRPPTDAAKTLIIGKNIALTGEITACDDLVVEGRVEINLPQSDSLEITASGVFKGQASVERADISGRFDGDLLVRDTLTIRASGRVSGSIRYGRIIIESGGEIRGDMQTLAVAGIAEDRTR